MSDLVRTLAFAYRRKGADAMTGTDLRMLLAYDLRWFAPEDAKRVVVRALELGLLTEQDGQVRPAFDIKSIEIPVNFRPTTLVLEEEPSIPRAPAAALPPPAPLVPAVAAATDLERAAEDERRKRGLLLSLDVARLIVRRRAGDDVAADAVAAESALLSAAAPPRP